MGLKGLMDKLNDAIREPAPTTAEAPKGSPVPPRAPTGAPTYAGVTGAAGADSASVKQFTELLRQATDDNRSPGHLKFAQQLKDLEEVIQHDVATRYRAAAKTSKVTAKELLQSVSTVQGELDGEAKVFEDTVAGAEAQEVGGARTQVQSIEAELQQLEQRVKDLRSRRDSLAAGITQAEQRFQAKRQDFAAALSAFRAELAAEKNLITTHLGGS